MVRRGVGAEKVSPCKRLASKRLLKFVRDAAMVSQSVSPSKACSTIAVAITSAGTDGLQFFGRDRHHDDANLMVADVR